MEEGGRGGDIEEERRREEGREGWRRKGGGREGGMEEERRRREGRNSLNCKSRKGWPLRTSMLLNYCLRVRVS